MHPDTIHIKREEFTINEGMLDKNGDLHIHITITHGKTFLGSSVVLDMQILKED
jgi:hypothetical protein